MNGDERQLISGLFDRMRGFGPLEKDREADALIADEVRRIPDAPYMLVQSVLVQEQALAQAAARIEELEGKVRDLTPSAAPSGGFLGGMFGGGRSSVPQIGRPATGTQSSSPGFAQPASQPQRGTAGAPGASGLGAQPQRAGGSFMQSAMATAVGVAGGMLLANSISSMLGGSSAEAAPAAPAEPADAAAATAEPEPAVEDAMFDDGGGWGDDGGDFEI